MPVYFAQDLNGGPIKIGHSIDVSARIKTLESHYGRPLALLATRPGGKDEERAVHERFAHLRLIDSGRQGRQPEQFRPAAELMEFIGRPLLVSPNPDAIEAMPGLHKQVKIEFPPEELRKIRNIARSRGMALTTFIRVTVLEKIRLIEEGKA